jgi:hypothetical protein
MPWLEVHEGCDQVESICGGNRYNKLPERLVRADESVNESISTAM